MSMIIDGTNGLTFNNATTQNSGGKVLQVVTATTTTSASSSTSTFVDTNLTATITPLFSTSKILVLVSQNGMRKGTASSLDDISIRLVRGSTAISQPAYFAGYTNSTLQFYGLSCSLSYSDSPATTSATTYKTQVANADGTGPVSAQYSGEMSTITLMEIAV